MSEFEPIRDPWQCPSCGSQERGRQWSTGYRAVTGDRVRNRQCVDCGARWKTAEVPILSGRRYRSKAHLAKRIAAALAFAKSD